jgi:FAD/FMN-containing dehydrogenase
MKRRAFMQSTLAGAMGVSLPIPMDVVRFRTVRQQEGDVRAVTGDGRAITLSGRAVSDLNGRMRGQILLASDPGYDDARRVLNPSIDRHPALIAQVSGTADIRLAVDFARENNLLLAVKCGGHSPSGKSTCDRGMMIDLSHFRDVYVDPNARRARVTGGSLLGALDHESMAYDLVTTMGTVSHTGVGGLVTGGGFGRVARRFGLAIDNLTAVDVVAADGQLHHANEHDNPDLFWGVRGGGGNFGVVTSFEFQLHPMPRQVLGGQIMFPINRARDVLRLYGEYGPDAPDEVQLDFGMILPGGNEPGVVGFNVCYSGGPADADRALAPIRRLGGAVMDNVNAMDYVALQRSGDIADQRARASYLKSGFFESIPSAMIDAAVDGFEGRPNRTTWMGVQQAGGAISRVGSTATAFPYRNAIGNLLLSVDWRYGDDPSEHVAWIKQFWTHLEPFTIGFYSNDGDAEAYAQSNVDANYGANYPRLVQIKNKYDPTNLFRLNANIVPTG